MQSIMVLFTKCIQFHESMAITSFGDYKQTSAPISLSVRTPSAFYTHRTRTLIMFIKKRAKLFKIQLLVSFQKADSRRLFLKFFWISVIHPKKNSIKMWHHKISIHYYVCKSFRNDIFCLMPGKNAQFSLWIFKRNISIIPKSKKWHQNTQYFVNNMCSNTAWNNNY